MEDAVKPITPASNISEIVSKFAKVCKFRSIGVFSSENPGQFQQLDFSKDVKDTNGGIEKAGFGGGKVDFDPVEAGGENGFCGHGDILKVFDVLSELKLAYVRLQEAHIPYDPDKIRAADELVFARLEGLCKIRRAFKEKRFQKTNSLSACLTVLLAETKVQERLLERLKAQVRKKDIEISDLKRELCDLDAKNRVFLEEIKRRERGSMNRLAFSSVDDVVKEVSKGIHDFAKPLIALMRASGWDLDQAANSIQDSVAYSVRSHKKYAFEAYISRRMFHGFPFGSYNVDDVVRFDDPVDLLIQDPHGSFAEFCRTKYLLIIHPKIEASFFGNLEQRNFLSSGRHPRTPFYQLFVKMARWVWVLQGIAASAEMFIVSPGSEFSDVYMENVEGCPKKQQEGSKVELMVMPGFRIGEKLIKSRIYLSKHNDTC